MSTTLDAEPVVGAAIIPPPVVRATVDREVIIAPGARLPRLALRELWAYRGLLYFLAWRDLKVRYTQTVLGVAWAVIQPVLSTVVFTIVFSRIAHVPTDGVPYALFALAAIVPWTYVSSAFATSGQSLLNNSNLITKVYFPRLAIPLAAVGSAGVDFVIGLTLLAIALVAFGRVPDVSALVVVPGSVIAFVATTAGMGCWSAALSLQYRDVKHLIPFFSTLWMYASPVVYPLSHVPTRYQALYALNPLAGTLEGFRDALVGRPVLWGAWTESLVVAVALFLAGAIYFQRTERTFADIV